MLILHCKTCAIVIGLLKATYLLTYLLSYYGGKDLWKSRRIPSRSIDEGNVLCHTPSRSPTGPVAGYY